MSIITKLEFELDFSSSEKQIARYILDSKTDVLHQSVHELAKNTYTSPATIVRFCHKLGLKGYSDFKIQYSAELQFDYSDTKRIDVNYPFKKDDSSIQIAHNICALHQEALEDTLKLMDYQVLDEVVTLLDHANRIIIFGQGNSTLAGLDFQHKMLRIKKFVELKTIPGEQLFLSYALQQNDIAMIISYSGETNQLLEIAQVLKKKKITIIGITSLGDNQLSKYCDYILHTGSKEKIFNKIAPYTSKTSIQCILDIIFSCIFKLHYDNYVNEKLEHDKEHDFRHPKNSPINDET